MKKILLLILVLTLLAAYGCSPADRPAEQDGLQKVTLVLDWFPNTNHTGLYVALEKGFFEQEGLDVSIIQPGETGSEQMTASGNADFGVSYQEGITYARTSGVPIKAVAAVIQHNTSSFASPADRNILSPKDFEGKTYGGWGSPAEEAMLKALMTADGGDYSKLKIINMGSADYFTTMETGNADFAWIFDGWTGVEAELRGEKLNRVEIGKVLSELDFYTPVLAVNENMEKEDPELIRSFLAAVSRGYCFAAENPGESAEILLRAVPELDSELVLASQKYLSTKYIDDAAKWGVMSEERWTGFGSWMWENGLLENNVDMTGAFTNEYLPE